MFQKPNKIIQDICVVVFQSLEIRKASYSCLYTRQYFSVQSSAKIKHPILIFHWIT